MESIRDTETSFGCWLRQRRHVLNLTQQELAKRVRCSVGTIRKIEADQRHPSEAIANRLADCLGIAAADHPTFIVFARTAPSSNRPPMPLPGRSPPAQILTTKLYVPSTRPALVPRPRLTERLNTGLSSMLTLIAAPAGFGKTTLLNLLAGIDRPTKGEVVVAETTLLLERGLDADQMEVVAAEARTQPGIIDAAPRSKFTLQVQQDGGWSPYPLQIFVAAPDDPMRIETFKVEQGSWPPAAGELQIECSSFDLLNAVRSMHVRPPH